MVKHFLRWNSALSSRQNETTPVRSVQGDVVIPDDVMFELVNGRADIECDPEDVVAVAVIDSFRVNLERGVYDDMKEAPNNGAN